MERGKHKLFRCVVRDLVRDRKPDILVIIEPRISGRQGDTVSRINRCRGRVSPFLEFKSEPVSKTKQVNVGSNSRWP
jgi:hypothetical protein